MDILGRLLYGHNMLKNYGDIPNMCTVKSICPRLTTLEIAFEIGCHWRHNCLRLFDTV